MGKEEKNRQIVKKTTLAGELTGVVVEGVVKGVWTAIKILLKSKV